MDRDFYEMDLTSNEINPLICVKDIVVLLMETQMIKVIPRKMLDKGKLMV